MLFLFFFFSSRRRHTRFDCDWSSDVCSSDLMALQRPLTTQNSEMYLRDMQTGEVRHLSPHAGDVQYNPQAFSPDGKYLYYTTDEGSEFAWLARYDLATGRRDTVERPSWDVDFAYFSKHGKYLVAGINADARTEIRLYEAATHHRVTLPRVPMGEIRGVQISPSERWMALYVNGSRAPSNLYVLDLGTGKLRRLTQNLRDRKSTRLNSSHSQISYAVFCLKKKKNKNIATRHK